MIRFSAVVWFLLVLGCASTQKDAFVINDALEPSMGAPSGLLDDSLPFAAPVPARYGPSFDATEPVDPDADPAAFTHALAMTSPAPAAAEGLRHSRFTIKGGYYGSEEDGLDDGYIFNLSWMRFFTSLFALELEAGYFDADGTESGIDTEAWGVPLMANARLNLPVWILDVYGGAGLGTMYYDASADAVNVSEDGWVFAGNAFLGATLNLADALAMGIEGKYYVTDDISSLDSSLDAYAVMLTLGWSR